MKNSRTTLRFMKNVLLLTATALLMRSVSLSFNIYLKNKLGDDGIGLFSLIMNLFSFAVTFATSGVALLSTRLVSEALGREKPLEAKAAMRKCILYSLFFGSLAFLLLFSLAEPLGKGLLGDPRTVLSLRALAVSLPFLALSSALSGYFAAVRRVVKSAAAQVGEQFLRIFLTVTALSYLAPAKLETMCLFVVLGGVLSDIVSFFLSLTLYRLDLKKHNRARGRHVPRDLNKKLLSIGLPVAFSSYFRSALVTVEHLLIPKGLLAFGMTKTDALAAYGVLEAMALPIILFPYAFLSPFCNLLVPEIAEKRAANKDRELRDTASRALCFVSVFGIGTAAVMLTLSEPIGRVICGSSEAAAYVALLAPLVPIMYADTTVDSLLKGVDEQLFSMRVNIFDSLLGVLLALVTVPLFGIKGYVFNIILCELINFAFSATRLFSKVNPRYSLFQNVALPLASAVLSAYPTRFFARLLLKSGGKSALFFMIALAALFYVATLALLRNLTKRARSALGKKENTLDTYPQ